MKTSWISSLLVLLFFSPLYGDENLRQSIAERVRHFLSSEPEQEKSLLRLQDRIARSVKSEINTQLYSGLRSHAKNSIYSKDGSHEFVPFNYKVPKWPVETLFFLKKDSVSFWVNSQWASRAYGSSGGTRDISELAFKEGAVRVKDVLLASKMIDQGLAVPVTTKYNFLDQLKDQMLSFDASFNQQEFALSYVRHFLRGDVSLGLYVPIVRRRNKIRLTSQLSPQTNELLRSGSNKFFDLYPNGLPDFFDDILGKKGISFNKDDTEVGLGDLSAFVNYEIISRYFERFFLGLSLRLPTARQRDVYKLWDPELGKSFTELSFFSSVLFGKSRFFNPHVFFEGIVRFSRRVMRRVPRLRRTEDITSTDSSRYGADFTPFGDNIKRSGSSFPTFSLEDTTVRYFSDTAKKTKLHPGAEFFVRVGNMFERFLFEKMFFDVYYDLRGRIRDYVGFRYPEDVYRPAILTHNTFEMEHRLGINFSYQWDDSWRLHLGALYSFAGRNVPRTFEINSVLTLEF